MYQTIKLEIEEPKAIAVNLKCKLSLENTGIGVYHFGSAVEYDAGTDYLQLESWEYDKSKYTPEEVLIIDKYINENTETIERMAVDAYEEENE